MERYVGPSLQAGFTGGRPHNGSSIRATETVADNHISFITAFTPGTPSRARTRTLIPLRCKRP